MAKITVDRLAGHPFVADIRRGCFYCSEAFVDDGDLVYWVAVGLAIWLHPGCAERLAMRLFHDAIKPASVDQRVADGQLERVREELGARSVVEVPGAADGA